MLGESRERKWIALPLEVQKCVWNNTYVEDHEPTKKHVKNLREGYGWEKGDLIRVGGIWVGFVGEAGS